VRYSGDRGVIFSERFIKGIWDHFLKRNKKTFCESEKSN